MVIRRRLALLFVGGVVLAAACATSPAPPPPPTSSSPTSTSNGPAALSRFRWVRVATLGPGTEWRFHPVAVDINRDGRLDLVATARLAKNGLNMFLNNGKFDFTMMTPTWKDPGYGALATGDINGDGYPDFVVAGHFERIVTVLSDGKGGYTDKTLWTPDGYTGVQLGDVNGDGKLDLIAIGFSKAGVEVYFGDGEGNWTQHATHQPKPGKTMPGRAVALVDLNRDGHLDIVAVFQRWGVHIYYGDGRGTFTGGPVDFFSAFGEYQSVAVADVNKDGNPDIIINGAEAPDGQPEGPDVYLGDGKGRWTSSYKGLKVFKLPVPGVAVADLDSDGHLDIVAGGNMTGAPGTGYGLFWFRGNGKGEWQLVRESGLPAVGFSEPQGLVVADLDGDGVPEIISLAGFAGSVSVWKRQ